MSKQKIKWSLEKREIKSLVPYEHNPRIIKGKKFEDLKKSIDKFGMAEPIIINTDSIIIGGHARFYALQSENVEWVDCYVPDRTLDEKEVKELNIRLNKNVAGEWDFEILANEFGMEDLKEWGFEDHEFGQFDFGTKEQQGKLDEMGGGESKMYKCPKCAFEWVAEKSKK